MHLGCINITGIPSAQSGAIRWSCELRLCDVTSHQFYLCDDNILNTSEVGITDRQGNFWCGRGVQGFPLGAGCKLF
jgi:hypothetical protein